MLSGDGCRWFRSDLARVVRDCLVVLMAAREVALGYSDCPAVVGSGAPVVMVARPWFERELLCSFFFSLFFAIFWSDLDAVGGYL